ncbi:hypothetical protein JD844_015328 [Phrynosoma platyrhinos]|uniref:Uncharacterized protein n=1 Tax=Phrynosoma platyrhinos TaxID=52577 RepID=A0ABQ7SIY7_PHRPL|nr:hypothetical protein JD844_015328 [Phrynosoma platyrhinos]
MPTVLSSSEKDYDGSGIEFGEKEKALKSRMVEVAAGEFHGQKVSIWEVLHSKYIPEEKQKELLQLYRSGILSIDQMETVVTTIVNRTEEEKEHSSHISHHSAEPKDAHIPQSSHYDLLHHTLRLENIEVTIREVQDERASLWEPYFSQCVSNIRKEEILHRHGLPTVSVKENIKSITTLITETESQTTRPGRNEETLREDQMTPQTSQMFETEHQEEPEYTLNSRLITLSVDDFCKEQVSLWDLLHSDYIPEEKRAELLQLYKSGTLNIDQMETIVTNFINRRENEETKEESHADSHEGHWEDTLRSQTVVLQDQEVSLWDLLLSHYIPKEKREELLSQYQNGILTPEELTNILSNLLAEATTGKRKQPTTSDLSRHSDDDDNNDDDDNDDDDDALDKEEGKEDDNSVVELGEKEKTLKSRMVKVAAGEFHGQKVSIWEVLHSKYIPEEKRKELLRYYRSGILTIDQVETVVTAIVNRTEEERTKAESHAHSHEDHWEDALRDHTVVLHVGEFQGQEVSLWDLLFSQYIPEEKREELLSQYRSSSLTPEEITVILGTLLAEPTTGKRKDPTTPEMTRHSDGEEEEEDYDTLDKEERQEDDKDTVKLGEKEKALKSQMVHIATGESHGQKVSIWEVLHSKYVPEEKQNELLQLYKSGVLTVDQMETIATSIFNKTEEENSRKLACVSSQQEEARSSEEIQNICSPKSISLEDVFRSESFVVPAGEFQGQTVSCWDLLSSKYVSEEKKQELLSRFRAEALSVKDLVGILTNIIIEAERPKAEEPESAREAGLVKGSGTEACEDLQAQRQQQQQQQELKKSLRTTLVPVAVGEYKGQRVCVLDLLFSKYVPQDKRQELLELYRAGTLPIEEMIAMITAMIEEAEGKRGKRSTRKKMSCMKGKLCWKDHGAHP